MAAIERDWNQIRERVRQKWAVLSEDDLDTINGDRDALCEKLRERFGIARDLAENELARFEAELAGEAPGLDPRPVLKP
jgi:uncharacterized protein YjbJ (UPF0337 family)